MAQKSSIQWTDATWNIARGCTKVDSDCKFCYMFRDSMNNTRYEPKNVVRTKTVFNLPLKLKEPSKIFTSSLTDFFHEEIDSYRHEAWEIIRKCPQHTFQILTKRPERILNHLPEFWDEMKDRVWLGTSVGSINGMERIYELAKCRRIASVLFISFEPLHEKIPQIGEAYASIFDWIIIGGESGNEVGMYRYRPCEIEWIEDLISQFIYGKNNIFIKQLGTYLAKKMILKDRHGGDISEFPEHLRVREFPVTEKQIISDEITSLDKLDSILP